MKSLSHQSLSDNTAKPSSAAHLGESNEQEWASKNSVEFGALTFGARNNNRNDNKGNTPPIPIFHHFDNISILPPNQKLPQTKLKINSPSDKYEQEADRVAEQVVRIPTPVVQRKCAECGKVDEQIQHQSLLGISNSSLSLQRKCAACSKEEETIQTKQEKANGISDNHDLAEEISANQNRGHSMDQPTLSFMESRFGANFSAVRIHEGHNASMLNRKLQAKAFTTGSNIFFNHGQYAPSTMEGKRLLAHELTHVVQQGGSGQSIQMKCATTPPQKTEKPYIYKHNEKDIVAKFSDEAGAESFVKRHSDLPLTCYKIGVSYNVYIKEGEKEKAPTTEKGKSKTPAPTKGKADEKPAAEKTGGITKVAQAPAQIGFALTFDDGPHVATLGKGENRTEKVLDVLKAKGIKAGFFIQTGVSFRGAHSVGKALVKRMQTEGHTVAVHTGGTKDHELHTDAQKAGRLKGELDDAKKYIKQQTGVSTSYVRPPRGVSDKDVIDTYAKSGLTNILWDVDGDQGKNLPLSDLKTRLYSEMSKVSARGWAPSTPIQKIVVLYHDIQKGSSDNLDTLIEEIKTNTKKLTGDKSTAKFEKP